MPHTDPWIPPFAQMPWKASMREEMGSTAE
jgi:hypothetical protein